MSYQNSLKQRLRVLFTPARLILFLAAFAWLIGLNVVYLNGGGQPEWLGPASIVPIFVWLVWELTTDARERAREKAMSSRQ